MTNYLFRESDRLCTSSFWEVLHKCISAIMARLSENSTDMLCTSSFWETLHKRISAIMAFNSENSTDQNSWLFENFKESLQSIQYKIKVVELSLLHPLKPRLLLQFLLPKLPLRFFIACRELKITQKSHLVAELLVEFLLSISQLEPSPDVSYFCLFCIHGCVHLLTSLLLRLVTALLVELLWIIRYPGPW